jgi:CubicO group peptidase (beta-lactamase class C family)
MRIFLLFMGLICLASGKTQDALWDQIDAYMTSKQKGNAFSGTVLVVHKGNTVFHKAYGWKDIQKKVLNDTNTIFRIGSVSKPITATVILQLVQTNVLQLTSRLSDFHPEFQRAEEITIDMLLSHRSGIVDYLDIPRIQQLPDDAPPIQLDSLVNIISPSPLVFAPGSKFGYSNSNYILLASIAAKVTGASLETLARKNVFDKAGMGQSGFDYVHADSQSMSTGYVRNKKTLIPMINFDSTYAPGCGSMYSTTRDLFRFYQGWQHDLLLSHEIRTKAFKAKDGKYGYGWFSYTLYDQPCISHAGGIPGFYSNMAFYPEEDLCIIILSNIFEGDLVGRTDKIAGLVFSKPTKSSGL